MNRTCLGILALFACAPAATLPPPGAAAGASSSGAAASAPVRLDLTGLDRTVAPGDDFFAYANGGWLKANEIPPDRSSYGTFAILAELTAKRTAELIQQAAAAPDAGGDARKIGDTYASFMDEKTIEERGLSPLQPALAAIAQIHDARQLAAALGATLRADVDVLNATNLYTGHLFGLWVAQDLNDPSRVSPFLLQGGLDMPDRDYYLDQSQRMEDLRQKYLAHVSRVLQLAGLAKAGAAADAMAARIFGLEHRLAESHASRVDSEDVLKGNNHWARADFDARAPGLDWQAFFAAAGLGAQGSFVVWQPSAVTGAAALIRKEPLETWKEWLAFHAVENVADVLPKAFADEAFGFHQQTLSGTPRQRDRWKRAVSATDAALGEAVGKLYVARYFPPAEKARAAEMARNELAAFARRIDGLAWMAPRTKARAKAKLAALKVYVGYPDQWRDTSALEVVRGDALGNKLRAELFDYRRNLAKLGKPVDRGEWVMNPQLINAVNLPAMNALNFPAAILQPPFFDPSRPAAMDYGAIGAVIGHEISHSFDDQGALFDEQGRLDNWWTPEDLAHFQASAAQLVKQFDAYRPFPDLAVNGRLTVSENIADVAGMAAAHDAWRLSLNGVEPKPAGGLTGEQQFFLSFAQAWRTKAREAQLRQQIITDGHAPAEYRADTVRNEDAWYDAFAVEPGQKLYLPPAERVRVW